MTALLTFLSARVPAVLALLLAALLFWQSARIEGLPLLDGGFKARIAMLERERDLLRWPMRKRKPRVWRRRPR